MMGAERRSMVMTEEEKRLTAYHESGHAILAYLMPSSDPIHKATIIPRGGALGMVMSLPEMDRLNIQLYYQYLLPVGKGGHQPGAEAVARWYKRNLFILHHILALTEGSQNQRVLVIFGQGHTAILKQFLEYDPNISLHDIQAYLSEQ